MTNKTENRFIVQAILSIRPNAEFLVTDTYESLNWVSKDQEKPTETEFNDALDFVKAEYDTLQYQRDRAVAYPSIQDVVVALAEKQEGDDTMWQEITALRQKVKADNPKP